MTQENNLLGKFHLKEIPPMLRDAFEIDVDANGILNVSAQDESITTSNEMGRLSQDKVCERAKRTLSLWSLSAGNLL